MMCKIDPLELIEKYSAKLPIPVYDIMQELGLKLGFEKMDDNISGWIERTGDGYSVAVNSNHPVVRQRFTAAHELGHYIYHRDLLGNGVGDTRAYRAEGTNLPNSSVLPIHERQANSFAANLLMPRKAIILLREQGITGAEEMAERFEVSKQVMCVRLGIICPN
jgi:Zn-dependent peptidase ImmA (M78 family)